MSSIVGPGATIGVLGSGQLGRMFAIAARRMGYRVHVLSPDDDTPTGQVADCEVRAPYNELDAVARFAKQVEVITFEFENVPIETIDTASELVPVRPGGSVLHTTQNRFREKSFLRSVGLPVTPFHVINTIEDLDVPSSFRFPAVLKTAAWGYDGKGQVAVDSSAGLSNAWESLGNQAAVLEQHVDFDCELSVVAARGLNGQVVSYDPIVNDHVNHILDSSVAPSGLPTQVVEGATEIAHTVLQELAVVGVLCVEFFLTKDGALLINELAPRPHNSGHLTVDAHVTCQFEQQLRAVCGLPLGSPEQMRPAAMVNLLGGLWESGELNWHQALSHEDVKLHLYGKRLPRPGRKMGHLTALADTPELALKKARDARRMLVPDQLVVP